MLDGFTAADVPDQAGRCFLVTGANTGIGLQVATVLAERRARVLLACRDEGKAAHAIAGIRAQAPRADVAFLPLDLADLDSVRVAAAEAGREPRIDALINNAGVMMPPLTRTAQGHELQFGVNHLGGFALTALLLPKLAEAGDARVVVTSSLAHARGRMQWDDLDAHRHYDRGRRYADSKLANLLHVTELDRRLRAARSPVVAVACHPGVAATDLMRHALAFRLAMPLVGRFLNDAAAGAWPALQAATAPDVAPGGYYGPLGLRGMRGPSACTTPTAGARNADDARRLWDLSAEMTRTTYDPSL